MTRSEVLLAYAIRPILWMVSDDEATPEILTVRRAPLAKDTELQSFKSITEQQGVCLHTAHKEG